jgi:hypothetical protein
MSSLRLNYIVECHARSPRLIGKVARSLVKEIHAHILVGLLLLFLGLLSRSLGSSSTTSGGGTGSRGGSRTGSTKGKENLLEVLALNSLGEDVGPNLMLVESSH